MPTVAPYHRGTKLGWTEYGSAWSSIVNITLSHMRSGGALVQSMIEVRDRYNAEWVLPGFEELGDLSPMIVADAVDNLGMIAAQVDPALYCPPLEGMKPTGIRSVEYANVRQKMLGATYHASGFDVSRGRFYRHLAGYATATLHVKPDFEAEHMRLHVRDPLTTYIEPKDPEDLTPPSYGCFVYGKSATWLRKNYPMLQSENGGPISRHEGYGTGEALWDVVEWWDPECMVFGVIGPRRDSNGIKIIDGSQSAREIYRVPNRFGFVPIICPTQVTMDRIQSAVFRIIGSSDLMSRFRALDVLASEKAVYPDRYVIGREGMTPRLVAGRWIDGREGDSNLVVDATAIGELRGTPDPSGKIAHDRLEGEAKRHVGLTGQMQGDGSNALRTGRALDSMAGTSIDPRAAEFHRIGQHAFAQANRAILAGYKGYFGDKKFVMFTGWSGDSVVEFTPDLHVEITVKRETEETPADHPSKWDKLALDNTVEYPIPGADVVNTTMALAQLRSAQAISLDTFQRKHPWIKDASMEQRKQLVEAMERGLWESMAQRMMPPEAGGTMHPLDAALVVKKIRETGDIVEAIELADELVSKRQAAMAPPPEADAVASLDDTSGLGGAGERGNMIPPPPEEMQPLDAQTGLATLTRALRTQPGVR